MQKKQQKLIYRRQRLGKLKQLFGLLSTIFATRLAYLTAYLDHSVYKKFCCECDVKKANPIFRYFEGIRGFPVSPLDFILESVSTSLAIIPH